MHPGGGGAGALVIDLAGRPGEDLLARVGRRVRVGIPAQGGQEVLVQPLVGAPTEHGPPEEGALGQEELAGGIGRAEAAALPDEQPERRERGEERLGAARAETEPRPDRVARERPVREEPEEAELEGDGGGRQPPAGLPDVPEQTVVGRRELEAGGTHGGPIVAGPSPRPAASVLAVSRPACTRMCLRFLQRAEAG